jgi:hypothetical protein
LWGVLIRAAPGPDFSRGGVRSWSVRECPWQMVANGTEEGQPPAAPGAPAEPVGDAAVPKKRSRWGTKTESADAAVAAAPGGGEDGGDAKRQRKSKVRLSGRTRGRAPPSARARAPAPAPASLARPCHPTRNLTRPLGCAQWDAATLAQMAVDVANQNDASRISKDALAKAQRMAAIQAQIQQQMQNLQAVPGAGAGFGMLGSAMVGIPGIAAPGLMMAKKETFMPAPLILDDKGRHVDSSGKEVVQKAEAVATLKANQVQRYLRNDMCVCMQRAISGLVAGNWGSCLPLRAEQ